MSSVAQRGLTGVERSASLFQEFTVSLMVCLATVVAVALALLDTPRDTRSMALTVFLPGAALMFGLALTDLARAREVRFARALIVTGLLWSLSALTSSRESLLYSVGHVSQWCVALAIVYLLLSYPTGQLAERADRALFACGALLLALLYLPTALIIHHFPSPSLWSNCTTGCPNNAFSLAHSTPAVVRDLVLPLREALTVALFAAVAVGVRRRARRAGPLLGRFYAPIAVFAVFQTAVWAVYFPLRAAAPESSALPIVSWIFVLSVPAVGLACGTGRLYRHFYAANALDRIAHNLRGGASPASVRRALVDALEDPSLRILQSFPDGSGAWVDESGSVAALADHPGDGVTEIASATRRIAIVHDPTLSADPFLIQIIGSYALAALENDRLSGELDSSREQLAESRLRRLTTEQSARQKIERDLHDGAQQRLVALRVKLELAATVLETKDPANARTIRALGEDVDTTIDEVRAFARGIYPALLAQTGLKPALRSATRDAPLPAVVRADRLGRYPAETEATVYFCCSEALQNACKHAAGATGVMISLWQDRQLHFEVRDDGAGFALQSTPYGTGLTNLSDRLAAVGGTMTIESAPGHGTVLGGSIPLA
jgi:signal transduction histidine kinase